MDIVLAICICSYVTWNHLTLLSTSIDREAHFLRPSGPPKGKYTRKIQKTHWMYKKWMFTYQFLAGKLHSLNWRRTFWDRTLVKDMVDNFWEVASIVMVEYLQKSTKCAKSWGNCSWNISFKTYCDLSVLYDKILRPFWGTIPGYNIDQLSKICQASPSSRNQRKKLVPAPYIALHFNVTYALSQPWMYSQLRVNHL